MGIKQIVYIRHAVLYKCSRGQKQIYIRHTEGKYRSEASLILFAINIHIGELLKGCITRHVQKIIKKMLNEKRVEYL